MFIRANYYYYYYYYCCCFIVVVVVVVVNFTYHIRIDADGLDGKLP